MAALLHNIAFVENEDGVRADDGGKAMGDDEIGAAVHQAIHGFLNEFFRSRVHGACGFVEYEDVRIGNKGAGDGQELPLTLGNL